MSATPPSEQSGGTIPCHCIIAHPDKPKFLVIRHSDGWSPPMLQVPTEAALMYMPAVINHGMMQKYSLRTTVLRVVVEMANYAMVEVELHASSQQQMQAVWVGIEEYARFRSSPEGEDDPLETWLVERGKDVVPPLRAPWQRPGWYSQAEQWVSARLIELGIQVRGSVQQFKAGWPASCLLRVSTVQGQIYFKASYDRPPGEARLTRVLARHWPDLAPTPLAVDEERHWLLLRDFEMEKQNRPQRDSYPAFARAMGLFQLEAMERMEEWRSMGCPVMDHDYLVNEDGRMASLLKQTEALLVRGPGEWGREDLAKLERAVSGAGEASHQLSAYDIPDSLSHLDFRPANFFLEDGKCRVIDWADVAVSHPFMMLCQTLDYFERREREKPVRNPSEHIGEQLRQEMQAAYLSAFCELLPKDRLETAFELARAVFPLFWLLYLTSKTAVIEANTPQWNNINSLLNKTARQLVERHAGDA